MDNTQLLFLAKTGHDPNMFLLDILEHLGLVQSQDFCVASSETYFVDVKTSKRIARCTSTQGLIKIERIKEP